MTEPNHSAPEPIVKAELDHLALASQRAWDNVVRYCSDLGATWLGGPAETPTEFYFCHVGLAGGTKLEFLQPVPGPGSEFLRRFLHRNGPGPHHFTFKVPDLDVAIAEVNDAGYEVVGVRRDNPDWQEAFLHPKQSHGIVIQIAQPGPNSNDWHTPVILPPSRQSGEPELARVKHLVADLSSAVELFTGPLAMTVDQSDECPEGKFVEVVQGPWRIQLISPIPHGPADQWLANRPGRLLQLSLVVDQPALIPDLLPLETGGNSSFVLSPEHNQGTRLLIAGR